MSHRLRVVLTSLLLLGLALASGWLGAFAMRNSQLIVLRVPEPRLDLSAPLQTVIWESQISWLVLGAFGSGILVTLVVVVFPMWFRRGYQRHRDRRLIRQLEGELVDLRNLPILAPAPLEDLDDAPELTDTEFGGASTQVAAQSSGEAQEALNP